MIHAFHDSISCCWVNYLKSDQMTTSYKIIFIMKKYTMAMILEEKPAKT